MTVVADGSRISTRSWHHVPRSTRPERLDPRAAGASGPPRPPGRSRRYQVSGGWTGVARRAIPRLLRRDPDVRLRTVRALPAGGRILVILRPPLTASGGHSGNRPAARRRLVVAPHAP